MPCVAMAICRNLGLVKELPPPGITRLTRRVTREMKEDAVVTLMKKIEAFESKRLEREQNKKQLPAVGKKRPEAAAGGDPHDHNRGGRPQMQVPAAVTHGPPPSSMPPPPAAAVSHNPPQGLASAPPVGYSQSMGMGPPAVSYSQPMVSSAGAPMGGGQNPWMWTQPQPFPFHSPFFPTAPRPAGFLPYN